jgi:L-2-hydroxyglutarate oxidase LhgO
VAAPTPSGLRSARQARLRGHYNGCMEQVDAVVIGAGVVGLAVARALALAGREVLILEAAEAFGTGTSARNSEVIHAGLYYPTGSLKARLCVQGKQLLYRYCAARGVAHQRIGKILVATSDEERPVLEKYRAQAAIHGVTLQPLSAADVTRMEPAVRAVAGLWSESTGIIDSHGLMLALLGDAESAGATLVTHTPVRRMQTAPGADEGLILECGGAAPMHLACRLVVNAAGHAAQALAGPWAGKIPAHYAKGHYFTLSGRSPFSHLVYPMPNSAGLGIHVTLDLAGRCRFGPDVTRWLPHLPRPEDYAFEAGLREVFAEAIRLYWPDLDADRLQPDYTGIRPKVSGPGEPAGDFIVQGPGAHRIAGLVNLFGIESPGLTSCMALAREVLGHLDLATDPADDF